MKIEDQSDFVRELLALADGDVLKLRRLQSSIIRYHDEMSSFADENGIKHNVAFEVKLSTFDDSNKQVNKKFTITNQPVLGGIQKTRKMFTQAFERKLNEFMIEFYHDMITILSTEIQDLEKMEHLGAIEISEID